MKNLFTYFLLLFCTLPVNAQGNNSFFEANEAYGSQNYTRAIELLESTPPHSFARYFNLGCAYQRNNDASNAWIAFEKAKQIRPYDKSLRYAFQTLSLSREQQKFIPFYQTAFVLNILAVIMCIFFWIAAIVWIRQRTKKLVSKNALYLSLIGCLGTGGALYASSRIFQKCIVISEDAAVHISPTSQSEVVKNLPAGTPLKISTKHENFLHIKFKNGQNGWIDCKNVKSILN
jgi:tetratricopeptide (TPR) repeat protein